MDKKKAAEKASNKLANQRFTLKQTLEEIEFVEKNASRATADDDKRANALLKTLYVKRNRQAEAIRATECLIELYGTLPDPSQLEIPKGKPQKR